MHVFHQSRRLGSSHAEPIFPRRSSFQRTQHSPSTNNGGAGVPSNHWPALEDSSTRAPSSWGPQIAAPHHQTPFHMPLAAPHLPNTADPLQQQLQLAASPSPFAQTPSSSVLMHDLAMEQPWGGSGSVALAGDDRTTLRLQDAPKSEPTPKWAGIVGSKPAQEPGRDRASSFGEIRRERPTQAKPKCVGGNAKLSRNAKK